MNIDKRQMMRKEAVRGNWVSDSRDDPFGAFLRKHLIKGPVVMILSQGGDGVINFNGKGDDTWRWADVAAASGATSVSM